MTALVVSPSTRLVDALSGLAGVTIRVRHELRPESMLLMETLGATVEIDESAPPCQKPVLVDSALRARGVRDHMSTKRCPKCARAEEADRANHC